MFRLTRRTGRNVRATGLTGERSEQSPWERQNKNAARMGGFFVSVYRGDENPRMGSVSRVRGERRTGREPERPA